jgi:hypothetical protein
MPYLTPDPTAAPDDMLFHVSGFKRLQGSDDSCIETYKASVAKINDRSFQQGGVFRYKRRCIAGFQPDFLLIRQAAPSGAAPVDQFLQANFVAPSLNRPSLKAVLAKIVKAVRDTGLVKPFSRLAAGVAIGDAIYADHIGGLACGCRRSIETIITAPY